MESEGFADGNLCNIYIMAALTVEVILFPTPCSDYGISERTKEEEGCELEQSVEFVRMVPFTYNEGRLVNTVLETKW